MFAVSVAAGEFERRGVRCETIMLCDLPLSLSENGADGQSRAQRSVEAVLDRVWAADALILATPVYFSNVSTQMKAFMDSTNDRFMREQWLRPTTVGLLALGGQGGFAPTIDAMRRYLDLIAPGHPIIEVATGLADAVGEAQESSAVREAVLGMARRMAQALLDQLKAH